MSGLTREGSDSDDERAGPLCDSQPGTSPSHSPVVPSHARESTEGDTTGRDSVASRMYRRGHRRRYHSEVAILRRSSPAPSIIGGVW